MREPIVVVASTWVRDTNNNSPNASRRCIAITLDWDSAIALKYVLDPDLCSKLGCLGLAHKLISGITEHTQESC